MIRKFGTRLAERTLEKLSVRDYPEGTTLIEIQGIYDGWCCAKLPDGTLVNRWTPDDKRYAATQEWIEMERGAS